MKSEQPSFVIYRRNTYEQYRGYNLFQNAEFKANFFNTSLKKMLTESCVMFFSPSRAVLSAILRDEYLTSAVVSFISVQVLVLQGYWVSTCILSHGT